MICHMSNQQNHMAGHNQPELVSVKAAAEHPRIKAERAEHR
jgi:hypothetical protein